MKKQGKPWIILPAAAIAALVLISLTLAGGPYYPYRGTRDSGSGTRQAPGVSTSLVPRPEGARLSSEQVYGSPEYFKDQQDLQAFIDDNTKLASLLDQNVSYPFEEEDRTLGVTNQGATAGPVAPSPSAASGATSGQGATGPQEDYSTTNNQVAGVDEADIVKSDGSYLYLISGQKVDIVAAYPPENAQVASSVYCDSQPLGLFVDGDMLAVFTQQAPVAYPMNGSSQAGSAPQVSGGGVGVSQVSGGSNVSAGSNVSGGSPASGVAQGAAPDFVIRTPGGYYRPIVFPSQNLQVSIYDTSDKSNPVLKYSFSVTGASYVDSRLIGDYVYLIANAPLNLNQPQASGQSDLQLPQILEGSGSVTTFPASAIQHFDIPYSSYRYTMVEAIDLKALTRKTSIFLTGGTQDVFVSASNIYLTSPAPVAIVPLYQKYIDQLTGYLPAEVSAQVQNAIDPNATPSQNLEQVIQTMGLVRDNLAGSQDPAVQQIFANLDQDILVAGDQTLVQKFQISSYDVTYQAEATVPGQVLNQFSMDEQDGYFRVATTTRDQQQWSDTKNNIFVYGPDLQLVGSLTDLAPGEQIYSARFLGNRAYLVTFKQIDPFFVVDLTDPASPKVLGNLNIPGFSDYLHPYDDNHVIGIGKDTTPNPQENGMPIPTGLKIALFDVTNPAQPVEISQYELPAGSDSAALYDHKAFLFSREKNLLALPVTTPATDQSAPDQPVPVQSAPFQPYYGNWQGAYVFNISLDKGITLKGTIDHANPAAPAGGQSVIPAPSSAALSLPMIPAPYQVYGNIQRILYIDDVLYTVSDSILKLNSLDSLAELKTLTL